MLKTRKSASADKASSDDSHSDSMFYVNKEGIPLTDFVNERMWTYCAARLPGGIEATMKIRDNCSLPKVPIPSIPLRCPHDQTCAERVSAVQEYMKQLQYNHTGTQLYEIQKQRPLFAHSKSAKAMIHESLPIKCLEATILGIYLTNGTVGLERFPISFKTECSNTVFRHVVLGLYDRSSKTFGSLGMSRRATLMYKPLKFESLSDLIDEFVRCYGECFHTVKKIRIGLPVGHDALSKEQISWKYFHKGLTKANKTDFYREVEVHARFIRSIRRAPSSFREADIIQSET